MFNISSVINEPFLISAHAAQGFLPVVASLINGTFQNQNLDLAAERKRLAPYAIGIGGAGNMARREGTAAHNNESYIGVIQISGVVLKADQACGPRGTKSLAKQVNYYKQDAECVGLVGVIDTPGGQVGYTDLLADAIRDFDKPTAAFVEGTAASAGYWLASAFDEIHASSKLDGVGSIGAFATLTDFSAYFEKEGIKLTEIYAPQSTDKNKVFNDAKAGEIAPFAEGILRPIVAKFIDDVKLNRSSIDESVFTGKMYQAEEAIALGMLDAISSFDDVVQSVIDRGNNNNKNKNMNTANKKYAGISAAAGFDTDEIVLTDGEASMNEETLDAIEARLGEADSLATANSDLETANADLQTQLDASVKAFADYKTAAAAGTSTAKKDGDSFGEGKKDVAAGYAHNRAADKIGK